MSPFARLTETLNYLVLLYLGKDRHSDSLDSPRFKLTFRNGIYQHSAAFHLLAMQSRIFQSLTVLISTRAVFPHGPKVLIRASPAAPSAGMSHQSAKYRNLTSCCLEISCRFKNPPAPAVGEIPIEFTALFQPLRCAGNLLIVSPNWRRLTVARIQITDPPLQPVRKG